MFNIQCFYNNHQQFKNIYNAITVDEDKKKFNAKMIASPFFKKWVIKMEAELVAFMEEEAQKPENIARRKKEEADIKRSKGHW